MTILDIMEIPEAQKAGDEQDKFELFRSACLIRNDEMVQLTTCKAGKSRSG